MRTLHIDTGTGMHGGQWQVVYLLERLKGATLLAQGPLLEEARRRGIEVEPLSWVSMLKLARRADLIHAHDARAHTMALVAGVPLVVSRRVGFPIRSKWKYARARKFLAVSKFAAARLREGGVAEENIRVVYDGVPVPDRATSATGGVFALANKCADVVSAAGVPVTFTSDLWKDLSTASIFVYMSEMEGLGSAALAASAAGVPVIVNRAGGLAETVEHERTGLMIEDGGLSAALQRLSGNPAEAAEMGRRGRELVQTKFSVDQMVAGTMRAYKEIVA